MKRQITRKTFTMTAVIGSIFFLTIVTLNTFMSSRQTSRATSEAVSEVSSFSPTERFTG
ncbi:MAG: hypothetical protein K6F34_00720 [Lachnospiraceae bacterium]|nr:hypothetical protein [Lachnospiraceae bacterium]